MILAADNSPGDPSHPVPPDDPVIATLKQRYLKLLADERIPMTPGVTRELDHLEIAIRQLQKTPIQETGGS